MGGEGSWVSVKNGSWHSLAGKGGLWFERLLQDRWDVNKLGQTLCFVEASPPSFSQAIIHFECGHTCMFVCVHAH